MMLFYPLLLAHVIGDFILQPVWLVKLKERAHIGILIHVSVVSLLSFTFTFGLTALYGKPGYLPSLAASAIVFVTHYLIDLTKVRAPKPPRIRLLALALDQLAHVLVGASIAGYFPILFKTPSISSGPASDVEAWLDLAALFLYATFAGAIFVYEAGNTFTGKMGHGLPLRERVIGMGDRAVVSLLLLFGVIWAAPVYAAARLFSEGRSKERRFWVEQVFSYTFAGICGLAMMPLRRW